MQGPHPVAEAIARFLESKCRCETHWKEYGREDPNCQAHDLADWVRDAPLAEVLGRQPDAVEALVHLLERVQWCPDESPQADHALTYHPELGSKDMAYCLVCRRRRNAGHASDCALGMGIASKGERTLAELEEQRLRVRIAMDIEEMSIPIPIEDWMGTKKDLTAKLAMEIARRVRSG